MRHPSFSPTRPSLGLESTSRQPLTQARCESFLAYCKWKMRKIQYQEEGSNLCKRLIAEVLMKIWYRVDNSESESLQLQDMLVIHIILIIVSIASIFSAI